MKVDGNLLFDPAKRKGGIVYIIPDPRGNKTEEDKSNTEDIASNNKIRHIYRGERKQRSRRLNQRIFYRYRLYTREKEKLAIYKAESLFQ